MNYEIKLYTHGVPRGQSTWGVRDFDANYIDTFYGRKSNVPVQLIVEVRQFNSSTFCYYTYLRTDNICDKTGRTGSYFALTLRINYYYADVQNIYSLLDAAYNKFVVGSIVEVNGGVTKYLVTDFAQTDTMLKSLEQELNKYLMQFSSDSDFISLSGFKANGHNEPTAVNVLECNANTIANHVKGNSSISVSPFHPSVREQQVIQKMTAEVNAANAQAQRQISEAQQNAQRDINAARAQAQQDVAAAIRDKETGIQAIRNEYKEADRTISSLSKELDKARKEITDLTNRVQNLTAKLQHALEYKAKYEEISMDLDKKNALLAKIRESLSGLSGIPEALGTNVRTQGKSENGETATKEDGNSSSFMKVIRKIHPFTDFFVMIVLLSIIGITLPKSCDDADPITTVVQDSQLSLKERFSKAIIDIDGISSTKPMKYGDNSSYIVTLINVEESLNGEWVSNDFDVNDNRVTPRKSGECTIFYRVGKDTLVTRTITVEK